MILNAIVIDIYAKFHRGQVPSLFMVTMKLMLKRAWPLCQILDIYRAHILKVYFTKLFELYYNQKCIKNKDMNICLFNHNRLKQFGLNGVHT